MDSVFAFPAPNLTEDQARAVGTLELAYLGDSVFDVYVRGCLTVRGIAVHDMHRQAVATVNARAQAKLMAALQPLLSPEEEAVVRRGRNAHIHHAAPRGVTYEEYGQATALEALLGYLFLQGRADRLNELLSRLPPAERICQDDSKS